MSTTYAEAKQAQLDWAGARAAEVADELESLDTTPSQQASVRAILLAIADSALVGYHEQVELKKFEVRWLTDRKQTLVVFIQAGRVSDEGTLGELTRPTQQFFIGRRGGIMWYEMRSKKTRKTTRAYGRRRLHLTAFHRSSYRFFA